MVKAIDNKLITRTQFRREFFADNWEQDVLPVLAKEEQLIRDQIDVPEVMTLAKTNTESRKPRQTDHQ